MKSATAPSTLILNVGRDSSLLYTRELLLQSAGYLVESASSANDGIHCFRAGDFDLVILCHSIPEQEREQLTRAIRNDGSATPVLFVTASDAQLQDHSAHASSGSNPDTLLRGICEVLQAKSVSAQRKG